ncbi:MAG TPA: tetratricopeptide repeat protein [Opitutaceae bacterium]
MEPPAPQPASRAWHRGGPAFAAVVGAVVLAAYFPCLRGGFLWDDDAHVTSPSLRSLHGLWRIWTEAGATQQYYPFLHSAFWAEHRLWGDSVLGYHLATAAFHACAAWLVFALLRTLSFPAPRLAALLFALHPVCAESVAWIAEQKNTLSAVLYLGAAILYLRFDGSRRRRDYSWALALFFLALLTKTVTATLPAAILVVLWWRRGSLRWRRDVLPLLPWLGLGAGAGLFTAWMEAKFIGAEGADFALTALERLLLAARCICFYAAKVAWPAHLMFVYPRWTHLQSAQGWASLAAVLCVAFTLVLLARRARGPLAGFLFFCGTLFPALGFVNVYPFLFSYVADHFQYLASLGIIVPAAWVLWRAGQSLSLGAANAALAALLLLVLGTLTWRQARDYRGAEGLYRATLARNPDAWLMHYNLGVILGASPGSLAEAIAEYRAAVRLKPDHWRAHNNLASALLRLPDGRGAAVAEYREAIRRNPSYAEARNNLAIALEDAPGGMAEAEAELREAIRLKPSYDAAYSNLGNLLLREGRGAAEAEAAYRNAIRIAPAVADYHYELANALAGQPGNAPDAVAEYREAIRLRPDFAAAISNLGVSLSHEPGRLADAVGEFRKALALDPSGAGIHANLASALARTPGGRDEAIREYEAALRLEPSDAVGHYALGLLLARDPARSAQAMGQFEESVNLDPESAEAQFALGISLVAAGRKAEGEGHLRRAIGIRPDFALARQALRQVEAEKR